MQKEIEIARVTGYLPDAGSAALEIINDTIRIGDILHFQGNSTDLLLEVSALAVESAPVKAAESGITVDIKVPDPVCVNDRVFKIITEI